MELEYLMHDPRREEQRLPLKKGTYFKVLRNIMLNELYIYSKYAIIFAISFYASCINISRLAEVEFHQLYMEHIDFAIIYYLLHPNVKHIAKMMGAATVFFCILFTNVGKECNIFILTILLTICGSFRWFGYTIASLQLFFSCLARYYLEAKSTYCLGVLFSGLIGIYACRPLPIGLEDVSLIFVVYMNGMCYSHIKQVRKTASVEVLAITFFWMIVKSGKMDTN